MKVFPGSGEIGFKQKERISLAVFFLIFMLFLFPLHTSAQTTKTGEEEGSMVAAAAKKEGKVVVSIPASAELRKSMEEAFKKRLPEIELELVVARGPSHTARIVEEKRAGVVYRGE